jgi:hypothetical protein
MKTCLACGHENPDHAARCQACNTKTFVSASPDAASGHIISPDEKAFWERARFCEFLIIMLRVQAVSFMFGSVLFAIGLPFYFEVIHGNLSAVPGREVSTFLAALRVVLYFAAAFACYQFSPRIVHWVFDRLTARRRGTTPPPGGINETLRT